MTQGRLIGVVGPSGVGKDTVMAALADRAGFHLVRRVITRSADAGGEEFEGVTDAAFDAFVAEGAFALHWGAHGLRYGIPWDVTDVLSTGQDALVNLSRSVLTEAQSAFAGFVTLNLTAPNAVLAERLAARGRESAQEIEQRLARAGFALPDGLDRVITLSNHGPLEHTVDAVLAQLSAERA